MKHLTKRHYLIILASAIILTGIAVYTFATAKHAAPKVIEVKKAEPSSDTKTEEVVEQSTLPGKKEYDLIETDMSIADAKKLLGEPSSETAYESQGRKNSTIMFNGNGDFGAYIMVTTSDGKIKSKSQFGLK